MLERILVPLDRSALAEQAIGQAMLIARGAGASIDLVLVHTPFPFAGFSGKRWDETEWKVEHDYLEAVARDVQSCSSRPVTHAVMRGAATEKICERATDADLIVMTSHGRTGLSRAWLGSVADGVVHRTPVPVLILRAERPTQPRGAGRHGFERILVPIDGSELSGEALGPAIELAKARLAITLGKTYRQEGALHWGYLTLPDDVKSEHVRLTQRSERSARRARGGAADAGDDA